MRPAAASTSIATFVSIASFVLAAPVPLAAASPAPAAVEQSVVEQSVVGRIDLIDRTRGLVRVGGSPGTGGKALVVTTETRIDAAPGLPRPSGLEGLRWGDRVRATYTAQGGCYVAEEITLLP